MRCILPTNAHFFHRKRKPEHLTSLQSGELLVSHAELHGF